jgi:hypothetical protein
MNSIDLGTNYRLYAFSDYQSMKAALPYMRRVVLAKKLTDVEEAEARTFVRRSGSKGFKNYIQPITGYNTTTTAINSLITALQALYKLNGFSARFIVVER